MKKIGIGDFTLTSTKGHSFPEFNLSGFVDDTERRRIFSIVVHPWFIGYDDCRRRVYVDRGCRIETTINRGYKSRPFTARINAGADYFTLLRFLWRFCDLDDEFEDLTKWLNDVIDCALNGIY